MVKISKTMGPIHFEDMDPRRFEDLVRELLYDFKDWYDIEPTGRSGNDDGYDVRAWEKTKEITNEEPDEVDNEQGSKSLSGNLWKIQCKREKEIGPSRVKKIIEETINGRDIPYGYILAAPANFSKEAYDIFRETLRDKGVTEFYLWGRATLEDMLHQPKNDHTLFTFFGVSLVVRRRSRSTEIKFSVNNKNKSTRVFGEGGYNNLFHESVLLRDFNDVNYPWEEKFDDFKKRPRWREDILSAYHPLGLMFDTSEYYAYIDKEKKLFDFVNSVDLINRTKDQQRVDNTDWQKREKISDFWKHLPRINQARMSNKGLVFFEDILIFDEKGDIVNKFPHLFLEFKYRGRPFRWWWNYLESNGNSLEINQEGYRKTNFFPKEFPEIKKGKLHKDKEIEFNEESLRLFRIGENAMSPILYDLDGKYNFLNKRDAIGIAGIDKEKDTGYIKITHKYKILVKDYLKQVGDQEKQGIERQIGRKIKISEELSVFEYERTFGYEFREQA